MSVEITTIPEADGLDTVVAYWHNISEGKGSAVLTCWGSAWTCYFGGMGEPTIQEFFAKADVGYLVNKLGYTQWLKSSKRHDAYLVRIIRATKAALAAGGVR